MSELAWFCRRAHTASVMVASGSLAVKWVYFALACRFGAVSSAHLRKRASTQWPRGLRFDAPVLTK
ncbi:hypothetical protein EAH73_17205 [Hymenobacter nivis]|uniref:Uncharacterized protein n=1 Tax=Hymenobacter nivis TaxID=1850093 RepID=A0A502GR76_9BACT|nr:hypothetical protein EAH73_17205 [Hymenobacter nivis]